MKTWVVSIAFSAVVAAVACGGITSGAVTENEAPASGTAIGSVEGVTPKVVDAIAIAMSGTPSTGVSLLAIELVDILGVCAAQTSHENPYCTQRGSLVMPAPYTALTIGLGAPDQTTVIKPGTYPVGYGTFVDAKAITFSAEVLRNCDSLAPTFAGAPTAVPSRSPRSPRAAWLARTT